MKKKKRLHKLTCDSVSLRQSDQDEWILRKLLQFSYLWWYRQVSETLCLHSCCILKFLKDLVYSVALQVNVGLLATLLSSALPVVFLCVLPCMKESFRAKQAWYEIFLDVSLHFRCFLLECGRNVRKRCLRWEETRLDYMDQGRRVSLLHVLLTEHWYKLFN